MKRVAWALTSVLALVACATPVERTYVVMHPRPGMSAADAQTIAEHCAAESSDVRAEPQGRAPVAVNGVTGAVSSAIVGGIAQGMADGRARRSAVDSCLWRDGYVPVMLNSAQWQELRGMNGEERGAFLSALVETQRATPEIAAKWGLAAPVSAIETPAETSAH